MALERKDLRIKLDADDHAGLQLLAEADQCDIGEWVENLIVRSLRERFDNASVLVAIAQRSGISGMSRE